ncbi:phage major capsid protein, P2 family [Plesiomonas shigelloides]|uniref:phage major capsid protein, P2 family n=1 Tax=Plesiomonas shigelloides TaxID=703 RepID=UPI001261B372|nr:phage major capsid protein, P2 family [Plesiomonas shigelloides]KAB7715715.1 phage major capsid protein, P2 family [Plesiomonas shigelloides]
MMITTEAQQLVQQYTSNLSKVMKDCARTSDNQFSLTEPRAIALRKAILEQNALLKEISCIDVPHPQGQVITVGESTLRTGRVKKGRFNKGSGISGNEFKLVETDSCCVITWEQLAIWANAGSPQQFFDLMNNTAVANFGLDMLRIGFNGTSVADTSDPDSNPNGEDVNIGWHQIAKNWGDSGGRTSRVLTDPVTLGDGGDYISLDAMASDLIHSSIPPQYHDDPRLVVLVGADLVAAESLRLYNKEDKPSERVAARQLGKDIAGRRAIIPPFMPGKRMAITMLPNLQILTLKGSRRRKAEDVGDRKQFENSYWRYEGYALGDPDLYAAVDETAVTIVGAK